MEKENLFHFIYKTTNLKNGKFYIGAHSTNNLEDGYLGSGKHLRNSIYYHGKEKFKREILEFLPDRSSLMKKEKEIVNVDLLKEEKCINIKEGGDGGGGFWNEEHRIKFFEEAIKHSKTNGKKGYERFKELNKSSEFNKWFRDKCSGHQKWSGKKHSLKTIEKMKKPKNVGNKNPQYGTCWITNGIDNKKIKNDTPEIPNGWYKGRVLRNIGTTIEYGLGIHSD